MESNGVWRKGTKRLPVYLMASLLVLGDPAPQSLSQRLRLSCLSSHSYSSGRVLRCWASATPTSLQTFSIPATPALKSLQDFVLTSCCLSTFKVNVPTLTLTLSPHPHHLRDLVLHTRTPSKYLRIILLVIISTSPIFNFLVIRDSQFQALSTCQVYSNFLIHAVIILVLTLSFPPDRSQHHTNCLPQTLH